MKTKDIAKFIKDSVKNLVAADDDTTYLFKLDSELAIYVGWGEGFDEKDETTIHSKKNGEYCVCVKIAEYNPFLSLWDNVYMPWYKDDGVVYDTDTAIGVDEDYDMLAEWLSSEYLIIKSLLDKEELTFSC